MMIKRLNVRVYRIPSKGVEEDGTFRWDSTTMVLVEAFAEDGQRGLGYSYSAAAAGTLIDEVLAAVVAGCSVENVQEAWQAMVRSVRNIGRPGIASHAISAVDSALWDLKACILDGPLFQLLGPSRNAVPVYGCGRFTKYPLEQLGEQLAGWVADGISRVKIKVGKSWGQVPDEDLERVRFARQTTRDQAELFVDANSGYTVKQAIQQAEKFWEYGVSYFEEPVPFGHLDQLAFIRERIQSLTKFSIEQQFLGSYFTAIGAFSQVSLGYFRRENMQYKNIPVNEQVEVLSLVGNIASKGDDYKIHAHVVLGKSDASTLGGHIQDAKVWPTLEVVLVEEPAYLKRTIDEMTGLALIDLEVSELQEENA